MNSKDRVRANLMIYEGAHNIKEMAALLDLEPDTLVTGADAIPPEIGRWELGSKLDSTATPEEHINSILEQLQPVRKQFMAIPKDYKIMLGIGMEYEEEFNPEVILEPEILKELGDLHIKLWFDIYFFGE